MQDTHDPFSFLLSEIRAFDAGLRSNWDGYQRHHYLDVLLIDEAQEIAWGRRHLTLIHGEPFDDIEAEILDEILAAWGDIARQAEWSRLGAVPDDHITLTIAGRDTKQLLALAAERVARANPGHWRLTDCPRSDAAE